MTESEEYFRSKMIFSCFRVNKPVGFVEYFIHLFRFRMHNNLCRGVIHQISYIVSYKRVNWEQYDHESYFSKYLKLIITTPYMLLQSSLLYHAQSNKVEFALWRQNKAKSQVWSTLRAFCS